MSSLEQVVELSGVHRNISSIHGFLNRAVHFRAFLYPEYNISSSLERSGGNHITLSDGFRGWPWTLFFSERCPQRRFSTGFTVNLHSELAWLGASPGSFSESLVHNPCVLFSAYGSFRGLPQPRAEHPMFVLVVLAPSFLPFPRRPSRRHSCRPSCTMTLSFHLPSCATTFFFCSECGFLWSALLPRSLVSYGVPFSHVACSWRSRWSTVEPWYVTTELVLPSTCVSPSASVAISSWSPMKCSWVHLRR